ncbi:hypothetical protein HYV73_00220 [Candidatus Uhrbacteria bacterium]|nr:hypothetical protein [Candidatus Uhrbacteria bacterium]
MTNILQTEEGNSLKKNGVCRRPWAIAYVVLLFLCILPRSVAAGMVTLHPTAGIGATTTVDVVIDTHGESVNAIEGELSYPVLQLLPGVVQTGSSLNALWIERPSAEDGRIPFAAMIPGGFTGVGTLFSISFDTLQSGDVSLTLGSVRMLGSDGGATPVTRDASMEVAVTSKQGLPAPVADHQLPTIETIQQIPGTQATEGHPLVSVRAFDAQTGIASIEYQETDGEPPSDTSWVKGGDVYQPSRAGKTVYIRVTDAAGNVKMSSVEIPLLFWDRMDVRLIAGTLLLILGMISAIVWRKKRSKE